MEMSFNKILVLVLDKKCHFILYENKLGFKNRTILINLSITQTDFTKPVQKACCKTYYKIVYIHFYISKCNAKVV